VLSLALPALTLLLSKSTQMQDADVALFFARAGTWALVMCLINLFAQMAAQTGHFKSLMRPLRVSLAHEYITSMTQQCIFIPVLVGHELYQLCTSAHSCKGDDFIGWWHSGSPPPAVGGGVYPMLCGYFFADCACHWADFDLALCLHHIFFGLSTFVVDAGSQHRGVLVVGGACMELGSLATNLADWSAISKSAGASLLILTSIVPTTAHALAAWHEPPESAGRVWLLAVSIVGGLGRCLVASTVGSVPWPLSMLTRGGRDNGGRGS
jgi:hypothetical protein